MFIMRLYKAKKIRKAIPNTFQIHKLLSYLPPARVLADLEMTHKEILPEAGFSPSMLNQEWPYCWLSCQKPHKGNHFKNH